MTVGRTLQHGPYEDLGAAYRALTDWINRNGLEAAGPVQERYLNGPGDQCDTGRIPDRGRDPGHPGGRHRADLSQPPSPVARDPRQGQPAGVEVTDGPSQPPVARATVIPATRTRKDVIAMMTVGDVMTRTVISVQIPWTPLKEVAQLLLERRRPQRAGGE